jgi:hypothetical protein
MVAVSFTASHTKYDSRRKGRDRHLAVLQRIQAACLIAKVSVHGSKSLTPPLRNVYCRAVAHIILEGAVRRPAKEYLCVNVHCPKSYG